jgi:hypothetical protein
LRRYIDRAYYRENVDVDGRLIVLAERLTIIPCRIVDKSTGGMKVELKVPYMLPTQVFLMEDGSEHIYECQKRWQNDTIAGLMLIDVCMYSTRRNIMAKVGSAVVLEPQVKDDTKSGASEPRRSQAS